MGPVKRVTYEVRKCANDCLVSAWTTRMGEISKLKNAPTICQRGQHDVSQSIGRKMRPHTRKASNTMLDLDASRVAIDALRKITLKMGSAVLMSVDL